MISPGPDAMSVSYDAADQEAWKWDEEYYCANCGRDVLMAMELRAGKVIGTCEHCQQVADYTPEDEDEGPVLLYCTACQCMSWCDWLREYEGDEADMYRARCCCACGSWVQDDDQPEPEVPHYVVAQDEPYMRVVRSSG
jgi:hypothetical protein